MDKTDAAKALGRIRRQWFAEAQVDHGRSSRR